MQIQWFLARLMYFENIIGMKTNINTSYEQKTWIWELKCGLYMSAPNL